jgi:hypothetical protein
MRAIAAVFLAEVIVVLVCLALAVQLVFSGLLGTMDANFLLVVYLTVILVFAIAAALLVHRWGIRPMLTSLFSRKAQHSSAPQARAAAQVNATE